MTITESQYNKLNEYIARTDLHPPAYSIPFGSQCTNWALRGLALAEIIPSMNGPRLELGPLQTFLFNPAAQALAWGFADRWNEINDAVNNSFSVAQQWQQRRRDPLTFDLDGDGIETVAASDTDPILFDHDGDGVKNGTGWVSADDGFLVMDRNGNGTIDNGTELFGDSTPLSGGGTAVDGFHALADQDTNADGVVNNLDANWNDLRVWQDINQDGESQTGELLTLDELGISGINVGKTENSQLLANGNQIADLGTFIKTDGTMGTMGEVGDLADVDLAEDTFHREFTDTLTIAAEAETLSDMQKQGSSIKRPLSRDSLLPWDWKTISPTWEGYVQSSPSLL
ncbi:MAG: hypothetical protein KKB30_03230 [Proteobacteria bacterium]|nr:hypothetical protein [Pseudomonadota bacterium]MBU1714723.1 hypothetical protein [Pseudomonadota bacterium]